jgi:hypothetical protein
VTLGRLLHGRRHITRLVIHDRIGAELSRPLELLVARGGRDHPAAERLHEDERGRGDSAAGAPDEHPLALLQLRARDQHSVGGHEDEREGGGFLEREVVGKGINVVRRDGDELGVRPVGVLPDDVCAVFEARVDEDRVPRGEPLCVLAERLHDASAVGSEDARFWGGGQALARPDVQMVQ